METKTKEVKQEQTRQFGLLSMIGMVVGIVIGSGIFAKNAELIQINGSIYITFASWLVGILLVLSIVIAFMELFSITERQDEQSTFANWSRLLINDKFAKFIGVYFVLFNLPISIIGLTLFASNRIIDVLFVDTGVITETWEFFITRIFVTVMLMVYFFTVNGFYTKPGRILSNVGSVVKVIPLLLVFVLLISSLIATAAGSPINGNDANPIFSSDFNQTLSEVSDINNTGANGLRVFALTLPSIIFVFDGFLTPGAMSKEGKHKSTYKIAAISGILIVVAVYLTYSFGVFALGSPFVVDGDIGAYSDGDLLDWQDFQNSGLTTDQVSLNSNYGEIGDALFNVTGMQWLSTLVTLIVAFSILTATSGIIMAGLRGYSDMSANDLVYDPEGKAIELNKNRAAPGAMFFFVKVVIIYFVGMIVLDAISIPSEGWTSDEYFHTIVSSNFLLNVVSVGSYSIMVILICAGLWNRRTKKVESDEYKVFIPSAIVAIFTMVFVLIIYTISLLWWSPPEDAIKGSVEYGAYVRAYSIQIVSTIVFIISTPLIYLYMSKRMESITDEQKELKKEKIKVYKS